MIHFCPNCLVSDGQVSDSQFLRWVDQTVDRVNSLVGIRTVLIRVGCPELGWVVCPELVWVACRTACMTAATSQSPPTTATTNRVSW